MRCDSVARACAGLPVHLSPFRNFPANRLHAEGEKTQGRAEQRGLQAVRPESIGAEPETAKNVPQSSVSSVNIIPETRQDPLDRDSHPVRKVTMQLKKRILVSKKANPEYR